MTEDNTDENYETTSTKTSRTRIERDDNHITILKRNTKGKSDTSRIWYDKEKDAVMEENAISNPNIPQKNYLFII